MKKAESREQGAYTRATGKPFLPGRCVGGDKTLSFPRKRESRSFKLLMPAIYWRPAYTGMTKNEIDFPGIGRSCREIITQGRA
jgi:hypothetical protein